MRIRAQGLHKRPVRVTARSCITMLAATLAALLTVLSLTGTFASASVAAPVMADRAAENPAYVMNDSQLKSDLTRIAIQTRIRAAARAAAVLAAHTYTVRSGDSLSSVAAKRCGQARMWTGIYAASRVHRWTGKNANNLAAGQHLYLSCAYVPSMLRYAPAPPPPPPVVRTVTSSRLASSAGTSSYRSSSRGTYSAPVQATVSAGTYSYAGLEALWVSAGGPSWAAAHAASIAECESGGRTSAYNPSGATGLWQILGSVVPGNLYNAFTNALNAVAKFKASGSTFAQWVCR